MLNIKERQKRLKYLGLYSGRIDGIEGPATRKGYKTLQNRYFVRRSDRDGLYGINTERLLVNAYRVKSICGKYFKLEEFKCECNGKYCTGYPVLIDRELLRYAGNIRKKYGATTITSGLRCTRLNADVGGIRGSRHTLGRAIDFYTGYTGKSKTNRIKAINWLLTGRNVRYSYCHGYGKTKWSKEYPYAPWMGNAIHVETK